MSIQAYLTTQIPTAVNQVVSDAKTVNNALQKAFQEKPTRLAAVRLAGVAALGWFVATHIYATLTLVGGAILLHDAGITLKNLKNLQDEGKNPTLSQTTEGTISKPIAVAAQKKLRVVTAELVKHTNETMKTVQEKFNNVKSNLAQRQLNTI